MGEDAGSKSRAASPNLTGSKEPGPSQRLLALFPVPLGSPRLVSDVLRGITELEEGVKHIGKCCFGLYCLVLSVPWTLGSLYLGSLGVGGRSPQPSRRMQPKSCAKTWRRRK